DNPTKGDWTTFKTYVADVNGDRRPDLVWDRLNTTRNRVYGAFGNGDGTFTFLGHQDHPHPGDWSPYRTYITDLNGDGQADIVWNKLTNPDNRTCVGRGNHACPTRRSSDLDNPTKGDWTTFKTYVADVNGDRRPDLV